jgi:hypothetical protein
MSVCGSAQRAFQLGYTLTVMRKVAMPRNEIPSASTTVGLSRSDGTRGRSLWAVDQRLANAERELRVQFIRIAQLQAQLDLVLGALEVRRMELTRE